MSVKSEAKQVAMKAIQHLTKCKYFYHCHVIGAVSYFTKDEKIKKEAYKQTVRALKKLGYCNE